MAAREKCICIIDMGNAYISAVIGEVKPNAKINVLALHSVKSQGLERGRIVDMSKLISALKHLLNWLEDSANKRIHVAWLCLSNGAVVSVNSQGTIRVADEQVSTVDMRKALEMAEKEHMPNDYYLADHFLQGVILDDAENMVKSPIAMTGSHLKAFYHLMMLPTQTLENLNQALRRANNTFIEKNIINSVATSSYALMEEEKKQGICMVDIGADVTNVAVYADNRLIMTHCIPMGGNDVTADLTEQLRLTVESAEYVKITEGCVNIDDIDKNEIIKVATGYADEYITVSKAEITHIIAARYREILVELVKALEDADLLPALRRGIVYCGGGSEIKHFVRFATKLTNINSSKVNWLDELAFEDTEILARAKEYQYQTVLGGLLYSQSEHFELSIQSQPLEQEQAPGPIEFIKRLFGR